MLSLLWEPEAYHCLQPYTELQLNLLLNSRLLLTRFDKNSVRMAFKIMIVSTFLNLS